ncbi:TetR-like C-terminal domain-containing protein, partial [Staphylococcus hominis]|nr:TetR-like C-terminal domain-containing protein [Staphylococcus hominis]
MSTIQSYHLNKYEKLLKALSNNFHNIKKEPEKVFKFFHIILKYIYRKKSFFHAIFISNPNRSLVMDYLDITKKYYDKILTENETLIQNRELFISYTISGQIGVILYW